MTSYFIIARCYASHFQKLSPKIFGYFANRENVKRTQRSPLLASELNF